MKRKLVGLFVFTCVLILALAGCVKEQPPLGSDGQPIVAATSKPTAVTKTKATPVKKTVKRNGKLKIALIAEFTTGTHASQYINGVKQGAKKAGVDLRISDANNDQSKMASYLDTAINEHVDGILIKHGRTETLQPGVKRAIKAGIPVVAFDVELNVPGVTTVDQDDYMMALMGLKQMAQDLNGEGNIVYIFVGGFAPMEKRNQVYNLMMHRYPGLKEVARFGNATENTSLDTQNKMEAILKRYPNKGDIKAIWAPWDEFAKGATRAIKEAGRDEIKVYGIDLSDEDLQMMQQANSPWKASAAANPAAVGEKQLNLLIDKLSGKNIPRYYSFDPVLVTQDQLPNQTINMDQLGQYVKDWNKNDQ
ncbi:sugar ABC transporter substrate-binding protein [Priestia koreensis]|uniref:LacI family transcriptional regulator n=1 Tax=Priestia koreensis TaxID=284581 RepID=A0A0M0LII4_9BACI|nr:sugar ABC transporter substrate-binding protein [Priestia koreensis]KOO50493.1 LacI family transcriptional regulator [Priestia koreensis]